MGYPLVTFSRTAVAGQWSVTQERFLTSGQLEGVDPALPPARYILGCDWSGGLNTHL